MTHTATELKLTMKAGKLSYVETNKYRTGSADEMVRKLKGDCELDSDNLDKWLSSIVEQWLKQENVEPDATVPDFD